MFLLDSNIFIEAKARYYGFDFAPGFWDWLDILFQSDQIRSIDAVRDELNERNDELALWVKDRKQYFLPTEDTEVLRKFAELNEWAEKQGYPRAALFEAEDNPTDFLLVAYAQVHKLILVTHEKSAPQSKKRVMIPDACKAKGVTVIDTFEMLRQTKISLVLENQPDNDAGDKGVGGPRGSIQPLPGL
jgi:hypothetical protein